MRTGCQRRRNRVRHTNDTSDEIMSGSSGPMKFELRYCAMANEPPATITAGHVSFTPRQPSIIAMIQNSTIMVRNGNWRPTIWPISKLSRPVTCPATRIGMPIAPNATGAVLTIRHRPAAYNGLKPSPTSSAAVIATGAPNPAAPSRNAPKQKPTISICRRWSGVTDKIDERIMSN
ncbi:hypothetical protein D3C78_665730 [compost metagenome]